MLLTVNLIAEPYSLIKQSFFEIVHLSPNVIYIYDFLSEEECDYLMEISRSKLQRSTVFDFATGGRKTDPRRTSRGCTLEEYRSDPIIQNIEEKISLLTNIPKEHGEDLQVARYQEGEEFKPHYDYFDLNMKGGRMACEQGGQRIATLIMYLCTPEEGGETIFPFLKVKAKPIRRNALLFYDCKENEIVDPSTLHGGAPVIIGEKWIATKWLRARPLR